MVYKIDEFDSDFGFFRCEFDQLPASVLVNLAAKHAAPDARRRTLLSVWIKMEQPNEQGLSSHEEGAAYDDLSNRMESAVIRELDAVFAGQITRAGRWELYFYAPSETNLGDVVRRSLLATPQYKYSIGWKHDAEWNFYRKSLYPEDPKDRQQIMNYLLIRKLERSGVDIRSPIKTTHVIEFATPDKVDVFEEEVGRRGYVIERDIPLAEENGPDRIVRVTLHGILQLTAMNQNTLELIDLSRLNGGHYLGCECVA